VTIPAEQAQAAAELAHRAGLPPAVQDATDQHRARQAAVDAQIRAQIRAHQARTRTIPPAAAWRPESPAPRRGPPPVTSPRATM
jgi:hypothetical protein